MAAKFKVFLVKRGIKQYELAKACGWVESKVSRFANGHKDPTPEEVAMMAEALGLKEERLRKEAGW